MTPAYCHFCKATDVEWQIDGDLWTHIWCDFRIPATHVWFPGQNDTPAERQPEQLSLWEE